MSTTPATSNSRKRPASSSQPQQDSKSPKKTRWDFNSLTPQDPSSLSKEKKYNEMAMTTDSPISALSELKEQLTCALCLDLLEEPKTMSCAHTFCKDCIQKVVDKAPARGRRFSLINCPLCREAVSVPREGFKTNTMVKAMVSKMKEVQVPLRKEMIKCCDCKKLIEKRDLFICSDASHQQSSSSGAGKDDKSNLVLCSLCVVTSHREHEMRTYIKQVGDEDREMAMEKMAVIRESINEKLRQAGELIVEELKAGIPVELLTSIEEVIKDKEAVRLWPKLEEQLVEADEVEARVDKIVSKINNPEERKKLVEQMLSLRRVVVKVENKDAGISDTAEMEANFTAASPAYQPSYGSASPDYMNEPASPDYQPLSPQYEPSTPSYSPSSPQYSPQSPIYSPTPRAQRDTATPQRASTRQPQPLLASFSNTSMRFRPYRGGGYGGGFGNGSFVNRAGRNGGFGSVGSGFGNGASRGGASESGGGRSGVAGGSSNAGRDQQPVDRPRREYNNRSMFDDTWDH